MYSIIRYFISKLHIFCMCVVVMVVGQFGKGQEIIKCNMCEIKRKLFISQNQHPLQCQKSGDKSACTFSVLPLQLFLVKVT